MLFSQIKRFIIEEKENEFILDIWNPLIRVAKFNVNDIGENEIENRHIIDFERFISKMMEIERACVEDGDNVLSVSLNKSFKECKVIIAKGEMTQITYTLNPNGYDDNWEIFKVKKIKK